MNYKLYLEQKYEALINLKSNEENMTEVIEQLTLINEMLDSMLIILVTIMILLTLQTVFQNLR